MLATQRLMKTEKIVLSFIAVVVGILVAGLIFYLYQATKTISPSNTKTVSPSSVTPTPKSTIFLSLDRPKDEEVVDTKTITISGKTAPDATIVISTPSDDQVISPAKNGNFSSNVTIGDGENLITVTAIAVNGEEVKILRTVTFSTESF